MAPDERFPALAGRTAGLRSSAIGAVLGLADRPGIIPLAAGSPAAETFPAGEVAGVCARLLAESPEPLQYGDTSGLARLRDWVTRHVTGLLGRECAPAATVLTHGSQQGLDLVCKAMVDPGDLVIVDRPSYIGALQVFNLFQAEVRAVPMAGDENLDALDRLLAGGTRPKLVYVVPNHANPTGLTLSAHQRDRLAGLAARHRFLIVEDDPYGELTYQVDAVRPRPIAARSDAVVRLGSFSKVLFPAARTGFLTAPPALAPVLHNLKQAADLGNSNFVQQLVYELVSTPGLLDQRITLVRNAYRARRDVLVAALRAHFGDDLTFQVPAGGYFVWARMADGTDTTDLLYAAIEEKMSFIPGAACYAHEPDRSTLRLSFSCAPLDDLPEAVARLHRAWRNHR